jgi:hypothetical protein
MSDFFKVTLYHMYLMRLTGPRKLSILRFT